MQYPTWSEVHISPKFETIDAQLADMLRLYNDFKRPRAHAYAYYFPPPNNDAIKLVPFQDYINHFIQNSMKLGASVTPYVADPDESDGRVGTVVVEKIAGVIALYLNDE